MIRLLVVDDHPMMRTGVTTLLKQQADFCIVGEAATGVDAVRLARELRPDVVVMDVSLPGLGGAEATKQILEADGKACVLALSAHEDTTLARALLDAGARGYALKSSCGEELVRAIRAVATGGAYVDPKLAGPLLARTGHGRSESGTASANLSTREAEVVRLIARGYTAKEMVEELGLSARTLETYRSRALSKLNLTTRSELIEFAMRAGWLRDV